MYTAFYSGAFDVLAFQQGDNGPVAQGGSAPILGHNWGLRREPLWTDPIIIKPEVKAVSAPQPEPKLKVVETKQDVVLTSLADLGSVYKLTDAEQKVITAADALEAELVKQEAITQKRLAQQRLDDDAIVMMLLLN